MPSACSPCADRERWSSATTAARALPGVWRFDDGSGRGVDGRLPACAAGGRQPASDRGVTSSPVACWAGRCRWRLGWRLPSAGGSACDRLPGRWSVRRGRGFRSPEPGCLVAAGRLFFVIENNRYAQTTRSTCTWRAASLSGSTAFCIVEEKDTNRRLEILDLAETGLTQTCARVGPAPPGSCIPIAFSTITQRGTTCGTRRRSMRFANGIRLLGAWRAGWRPETRRSSRPRSTAKWNGIRAAAGSRRNAMCVVVESPTYLLDERVVSQWILPQLVSAERCLYALSMRSFVTSGGLACARPDGRES